MMKNKKIIPKLIAYAADRIHKLAQKDSTLEPLDKLIVNSLGNSFEYGKILTDKEAERHIIITSSIEDFPGYNFTPQLRQACFDIAFKTLEIAADTHSTNAHMVQVAHYLHPLLSQDNATIDIGWDLEEYIDWYFTDNLTAAERKKGYDKLMSDWISVRKQAEKL